MRRWCCRLQAAQDFPQSRKIDLVARALRAALLASPGGQGRFLRPILASFAVVEELEGALGIVKQVKERQLAAESESSFLVLVPPFIFTGSHHEYCLPAALWCLKSTSLHQHHKGNKGLCC